VTSGALRLLSNAVGTVQNLRVSGGSLDLQGGTNTFATVGLTGGTLANGTFATSEADYTNLQTGTVAGQLTGSKQLIKNSAGTLTLSGSNNYTGATTISNGTVALSAGGSISINSALDLAGATASFDIAGLTASGSTNASLAGVAGSVVNLGSKNLNVGGNNTSTTFAGTITNTGSLTKSGNGTLTLSGANAYTGTTTVNAGTLVVATNGSLRFGIGGSGSNNAVLGSGTTTMNGRFGFDLASASTNTNATWTIVAGTLTNTYGTDFIVTDFNGNVASGLWTNTTNGVNYVFAQSNSVLSVQSNDMVPSYTAWVNYWQGLDPTFTNTAGNADPDGDEFDNDVEFAFDGNPTVGTPALMTATPVGSNAVFNWIQRTNDVGYMVQKNGTLTNEWTEAIGLTVSDSTDQTGVLLAPTYVRKEFIITNATGKDFYRVRATFTP
jgi:autotransporter-associated beta strand protein